MRSSPRRRIVPLVAVLWAAPGSLALATALHVALDHHAESAPAAVEKLAELARAAAHGHHHELADSTSHDHAATIASDPPSVRTTPTAVAESVSVPAPESLAEATDPLAPRRGPPDRLFTLHRNLRL